MELYKINGKNGVQYTMKDDCLNEVKNGRLTYFARGEGWHTTKKFEVVDVDLQPRKDALYIGKIAKEYGNEVAAYLCENAFGCCRYSAENWTDTFMAAYETAVENGIDPSEVAVEVANNIRGFFGMLDIVFLESKLAGLDPEFEPSRCRYKGRENVSTKEYITEKYGEPTTLLIEKLIG